MIQESIVAAALNCLMADNTVPNVYKIFSMAPPARHNNLIIWAAAEGAPIPIRMEDQGFLTNTGRYVGRETALVIATSSGQLIGHKKYAPLYELLSEDLW